LPLIDVRRCFSLLSVVLLIGGLPAEPVAAQTSLEDEFDSRELNWRYWCPCQIDMKEAPIEFLPDPDQGGDGIARITANEASLGGNVCRYEVSHDECRPPTAPPADLPEPLGPSLVKPLKKKLRNNPYCTEDVMRRALDAGEESRCIQRQELRFQKSLQHEAGKPHRYSLRFRMPAKLEDRKNSIRWVTAQWRQEPVSDSYAEKGDVLSPFLAQRFDDGVLHVTVQDEHCRCKVASAANPDGSRDVWKNGPAQYCEWTSSAEEGACSADLQVEYGANPVLPSALGRWVEMSYRVEAGRSGRAVIEVHAGERFIVRVTGNIGYEPNPRKPSVTKFKVGHYRDYIPFKHSMDIDWVKVEPVSK
jgi:hypothetical protein